MKKYSYEVKNDKYTAKYIVKAENKEDAAKKITQICGERVTRVKEE